MFSRAWCCCWVAVACAIGGSVFCNTPVRAQGGQSPLPAPSQGDVQAAQQQLRASFQKQYHEAQSPVDRDELAWMLIKSAAQKAATPEQQFAALDEACTIAVQVGAPATALTAVERLINRFQLDAWEYRTRVIGELTGALAQGEQRHEFTFRVAPLVEQAVDAGEYAAALEVATQLAKGARGIGDNLLMRRIGARQMEIKAIEKASAEVQPHEARLAESLQDAEASLQVGRFLGFYRGDWERGLPLLARGNDEKLRGLASRSKSATGSAEESTEVGDGWWDLSRKESGIARTHLERQALVAYRRALDAGLTGSARTRVQKRIDDAAPGQVPTAREKDGIAPAQMLAAFGMDPIRWKIVADELHGEATASRDDLERFVSAKLVTATSFRFGFRIKAPQYQAISVVRGDEVYEYSRGHWLNKGACFALRSRGWCGTTTANWSRAATNGMPSASNSIAARWCSITTACRSHNPP